MKVLLANPRGSCAGVVRAVEIVERALDKFGSPVYVRHEIVHNRTVIENLKNKGAVFIDELEEIPDGAVTIFSAHGVSQEVENDAKERGLPVIDATCPLVDKVHRAAQRYSEAGFDVVLIGHRDHPEVVGTMGRISGPVHLVSSEDDVARLEIRNPDKLAYSVQTTLSVDDTREIIVALKARFPEATGSEFRDICYATQNRQMAVRDLCNTVDLLLVIGSPNSSNTNRLRELGEKMGVPSRLVEGAASVNPAWFEGIETVGITAGASAPEPLIQKLVERLRELGAESVAEIDGVEENVIFKLPRELQDTDQRLDAGQRECAS